MNTQTQDSQLKLLKTDEIAEAIQGVDQKKEVLLSPQIIEALQQILEDLKTESEVLNHAVITDSAGNIVSAVSSKTARMTSAEIRDLITKTGQFSERLNRELDLGAFDEIIILSETGLMLLYPIEHLGAMGVTTLKENQGMVRWNCREALEKITEVLTKMTVF